MNKKTSNKKYDLNKGKIIGALRALGLSEKAKPIREGLRDILATFIEFTDEIEGIAKGGPLPKTYREEI